MCEPHQMTGRGVGKADSQIGGAVAPGLQTVFLGKGAQVIGRCRFFIAVTVARDADAVERQRADFGKQFFRDWAKFVDFHGGIAYFSSVPFSSGIRNIVASMSRT